VGGGRRRRQKKAAECTPQDVLEDATTDVRPEAAPVHAASDETGCTTPSGDPEFAATADEVQTATTNSHRCVDCSQGDGISNKIGFTYLGCI